MSKAASFKRFKDPVDFPGQTVRLDLIYPSDVLLIHMDFPLYRIWYGILSKLNQMEVDAFGHLRFLDGGFRAKPFLIMFQQTDSIEAGSLYGIQTHTLPWNHSPKCSYTYET